jgi:peptidyl-prolyl cis-trans isomerase C
MIAVNGMQIGESAILAEMQYHPAPSRDEALAQAAEALVVRELLLQRAAALGLTWTDDDAQSEERAIDELLARELKLPKPDAGAYRRYYDNNRAIFCSPHLFEASHILYLAPRDDAEARARAKAAAVGALSLLKGEPERFADIARAQSRCSSAGEGGRLGQIAAGETTPEFDTFLMALEDEQICPVPVETDYGVHVLKLHRRIAGKQFAFEEVEAEIARNLNAAAWRRAVSGYISLLAAGAKVEGLDIRKASSPLVQ